MGLRHVRVELDRSLIRLNSLGCPARRVEAAAPIQEVLRVHRKAGHALVKGVLQHRLLVSSRPDLREGAVREFLLAR